MPSLFHGDDRAQILERIQSLDSSAGSHWGKMSAAQMLAHCQAPLRVATGQLELKRGLAGLLFGRLAKKSLSKPEPFRRGLPTAPEFVVKDAREFSREQKRLVELVQEFGNRGPEGVTSKCHPFFGPLTAAEWDTLQWKHLDHHLRPSAA